MKGWRQEGDCFAVKTLAPDLFEVRHYPDYETRKACCRIRVRVNAEDRAQAIPDADPHGVAAALGRVDREIARRHGIVDNKSG